MAVVLIQHLPGDFDPKSYDAVNDRMGVEADPPEGLISHTLGVSDAGAVIVDVWESEDHHDRFVAERLNPAMEAVFGSETFAAMPTVERNWYPVHHHTAP